MDSKETIIQTAKKLFSQKGFRATTIRDIANDSGLNSSLISYHFNGKEGLLRVLTQEVFSSEIPKLSENLEGSISNNSEFKIRLEYFMHNNIKLGIKHWDVVSIILAETQTLSKFKEFNIASLSSLKSLSDFMFKAQSLGILKSRN